MSEPITFGGVLAKYRPLRTIKGLITGIDTSAWAPGVNLYLDPFSPGGLTGGDRKKVMMERIGS